MKDERLAELSPMLHPQILGLTKKLFLIRGTNLKKLFDHLLLQEAVSWSVYHYDNVLTGCAKPSFAPKNIRFDYKAGSQG
jgi:hypothetical protein